MSTTQRRCSGTSHTHRSTWPLAFSLIILGWSGAVTPAHAGTNGPPVVMFNGMPADTLFGTTTGATPLTFCIEAIDPDGDALDVTAILNTPLNGSASGTSDGDTCFQYFPDPGFFGNETLIAVVCDGNGGCDTVVVIIQVVPNAPPVAVDDTASTPFGTPVTIDVLANDTDPNGDPLTVTMASAANGTVVIDPDGMIIDTPNAGFCGTDTIGYTVCDTEPLCDDAIVVVTVECPPNGPPVAADDLAGTAMDTPVTIDVLANDSDPDGDPLSVSIANADNGAVVINGDNTLTYTPAPGFCGVDTINYSTCDTEPLCDDAVVIVTVTCAPDQPPVAVDDTAGTNMGTPVVIDVLVNDSDPDGDAIAVTSANAGNGLVVINGDGTITYTPDASFCGVDTIAYTICDDEALCDDAIVVVQVPCPPDQPPVAVNDVASTGINTPVVVDVLDNDSDPDGDPITVTAAVAGHGTVVINGDGTITYTPDPLFCGTDIITYTICDPDGLCDNAIVTINIPCPPNNDPPVAWDDSTSTPRDVPLVINVLANDTDPNGDMLIVSSADAAIGMVTINDDGTLTYVAPHGFCGEDIITYIVCDPGPLCDEGRVVVAVECPDTSGLAIPQGFSPNNDGYGDLWVIRGLEKFPLAQVTIFDRWGNEVYGAAPYRNDWDGRSTNRLTWDGSLPVATYWYLLDLGVQGEGVRSGFIYLNR